MSPMHVYDNFDKLNHCYFFSIKTITIILSSSSKLSFLSEVLKTKELEDVQIFYLKHDQVILFHEQPKMAQFRSRISAIMQDIVGTAGRADASDISNTWFKPHRV